MHSGDLSHDQLQKLYWQIRPICDYLNRLEDRMEQQGFSEADKLYREVLMARLAAEQVADELHRLWVGPGYRRS